MHKRDFAVNCSILLTHIPLLERFAAAKSFGFDAVEVWWPLAEPTPDVDEVDAFVRAIENSGVQLSGLNLFDGIPNERGLASLPGREAEFRANLDVVSRIAERTGCRKFNALYGRRKPGVSQAAQDETAMVNLAAAADALARIGGTILLEPISGDPDYPLKTAQDVIDVLDRVARPNAGLLLDIYHLTVNADDVDAVIAKHADRIAHVQVADVPGRGAPGTGRLPIRRWMAAIRGAGYEGLFGLEYADRSADPFAWLESGMVAG